LIDHVVVDTAPRPAEHYSQAVRAGDFVFLAGQVPRGIDGSYVPASVREETDLMLRNVAASPHHRGGRAAVDAGGAGVVLYVGGKPPAQ